LVPIGILGDFIVSRSIKKHRAKAKEKKELLEKLTLSKKRLILYRTAGLLIFEFSLKI